MRVEIANPHFRKNTQTELKGVVLDLRLENEATAALGDMVCWLPAISYAIKNTNYIKVHLVAPKWFHPVAENALRGLDYELFFERPTDEYLSTRFKEWSALGQRAYPINATSTHLIDLGFIYFYGLGGAPKDYREYLDLDLSGVNLKGVLENKKYAVLTPCFTAYNRRLLVKDFNLICDHLNSKGIVPVFLGDKHMAGRDVRTEDYDLSKGINLLGKTTLLEAAKIMKKSEMVMGVDNGLLHLAAMTDATILYGYTIAGPETRRVYRKSGHTYELYGSKKDIPCLFCQENIRFIGKNFSECLYQEVEPECVKALNAASFNATIDMHLEG